MESAETAEERKQRKKLQNRLNQRARRSRLREKDIPVRTNGSRPYQVNRWRYTYQDAADANGDIISIRAGELYISSNRSRSSKAPVLLDAAEQEIEALVAAGHFSSPSPSQDHLLHLIQLNVLRGLFDNKLVLLHLASYLAKSTEGQELQIMPPEQVFPGRAAIISTATNLPESLRPTPLQNTLVHATCIDLLPFPKVRDNLIEQEGRFSWAELLEDLVGNLVNPFCFFGPHSQQGSKILEQKAPYHGYEDDFTANRNGVIVWGAAHRPESWEVTSGFLQKWGWSLKGCKEIIESTNRWRETRGEEPLTRST